MTTLYAETYETSSGNVYIGDTLSNKQIDSGTARDSAIDRLAQAYGYTKYMNSAMGDIDLIVIFMASAVVTLIIEMFYC